MPTLGCCRAGCVSSGHPGQDCGRPRHRPVLALDGAGLGTRQRWLANLERSHRAFSPGFLPTVIGRTALLAPRGTHTLARHKLPRDVGISRAGKTIDIEKASFKTPQCWQCGSCPAPCAAVCPGGGLPLLSQQPDPAGNTGLRLWTLGCSEPREGMEAPLGTETLTPPRPTPHPTPPLTMPLRGVAEATSSF